MVFHGSLSDLFYSMPMVFISRKGKLETTEGLFKESRPQLDFCLGQLAAEKWKGQHWIWGEPAWLISEMPEPKGLDSADSARVGFYKIFKTIDDTPYHDVGVYLPNADEALLKALFSAFYFARYRFDLYKSKKSEETARTFHIWLGSEEMNRKAQALWKEWEIRGEAQKIARDLVNEPGGSLTPADFAGRVTEMFKGTPVQVKVISKDELLANGYNGLWAVGKGSPHLPCLVELSLNQDKKAPGRNLGLVGKGITFDTGGVCLKTPGTMWEMRCDMAGAAAVTGAMWALSRMDIQAPVIGVLCLAENRMGEHAILPGDIFKTKKGKTVMVENTDAEGRLVLSDGLAWAESQGVSDVVDLATLTGAIVRALGPVMSGLFSNSEDLQQKLVDAGRLNSEKIWPMPLEMEYRELLDDTVADMRNIGGEAGAITAAVFLAEFIPEGARWAHLDIAGTAFTTKDWKYYGKGGTGWGVQTLIDLAKGF